MKNLRIYKIIVFYFKKDLTQEKLAEIMDVSQNYIAGIERGKAKMSLAKILELSQAMDVNIEILLKFNE